MQIENLDVKSPSLIINRDLILENQTQSLLSYLEANDLINAFEEFKKLYFLVISLSGSLYVINEFATSYSIKIEEIIATIKNKLDSSAESFGSSFRFLKSSLMVYTIYNEYLDLMKNSTDGEAHRKYHLYVQEVRDELRKSNLESSQLTELLILVDFFKLGIPATTGRFSNDHFERRQEFIDGFIQYININPVIHDNMAISNLCSNIGGILLEGDLDGAKLILDYGLMLAQESNSHVMLTRSLTMLGHFHRLKGQLDVALDTYQLSIEYEDVPHLLFAYPIRHIGQILQTRGELNYALIYYEKSLRLFEETSNDLGVARTLQYTGNIHFLKAQFDAALDYYSQSLDILLQHHYQRMIVDVLYSQLRVFLERYQIAKAEDVLGRIQVYHEERDHKGMDQVYRLSQALIYKTSKRRIKKAKSQELLEEIINEPVLNQEYTIVAMQNLCELLVDEMRTEPAEEIFIEASTLVKRLLTLGQEQELYQVQIQALILQSQFDMIQGNFDDTLAKLSKAESMCREKNLPQLTQYVLQFRERYLAEFSKWQGIVHGNETIQDRLANEEIQEYIKLALATVQEEKQQTETLLKSVLPVEVIPHLKNKSREVYAERFENVSILFADIVGFTSLTTILDPHDMVLLLNEIFTSFDKFLPKYDVEKIRTIGDNYMVIVGAPRRNPSPSKMLAKFALAISNYLNNNRELLEGVKFRLGMNTGEVVAGIVGSDRFHFDVWGDAVNVAARMESHGVPNRIQVTERVYLDLKDEFVFEERGEIDIKGKDSIRTWFLIGERE